MNPDRPLKDIAFYKLDLWPDDIIVKPQMRISFSEDSIADLAKDIENANQLYRCFVYDKSIFESYQGNEEESADDGDERKFVLIAGERRLRAVKILGDRPLYCRVYDVHSLLEVFTLQASENKHEDVPRAEEAKHIHYLWLLAHEANPEMTMKEFCRRIVKPEKRVSNALRFVMKLDQRVSQWVYDGMLDWSKGLAISRIKDQESQFQVGLEIMTMFPAPTLTEVNKKVGSIIWEENGQENFLTGLLGGQEFMEHQHRIRIETSVISATRQATGFLNRVLYLIEKGYAPKEFLTESAKAALGDIIDLAETVKSQLDVTELLVNLK